MWQSGGPRKPLCIRSAIVRHACARCSIDQLNAGAVPESDSPGRSRRLAPASGNRVCSFSPSSSIELLQSILRKQCAASLLDFICLSFEALWDIYKDSWERESLSISRLEFLCSSEVDTEDAEERGREIGSDRASFPSLRSIKTTWSWLDLLVTIAGDWWGD